MFGSYGHCFREQAHLAAAEKPASPGPGSALPAPNRMLCGRWLKVSSVRFSDRIDVRASENNGTASYSNMLAAEPTLSTAPFNPASTPSGALNGAVDKVGSAEIGRAHV